MELISKTVDQLDFNVKKWENKNKRGIKNNKKRPIEKYAEECTKPYEEPVTGIRRLD